MKHVLLFCAALCLFGTAAYACEKTNKCASKKETKEQKIDLKKVPAAVIKAAKAMENDIVLTKAEVEKEGNKTVYDLEGTVKGKECEIEVTVDKKGKVVKIKIEDDDDDEGDKDDDDDNDEDED